MERKPRCHWQTGRDNVWIEDEVKSRKHSKACGKPAKWEVEWLVHNRNRQRSEHWWPVCGIHRNTAEKMDLQTRPLPESIEKIVKELEAEFGDR